MRAVAMDVAVSYTPGVLATSVTDTCSSPKSAVISKKARLMNNRLHVILSCTNRKTVKAGADLHLSALAGAHRLERWTARLQDAERKVRASKLYAGEYWREGMALVGAAGERVEAHLWILSAGYGLVGGDDLLAPYEATLAVGHVDSVAENPAKAEAANRSWMASLAEWEGPGGGHRPRTLFELASQDPNASMIVCAGPAYVAAVLEDLRGAGRALAEANQLLVFGSARQPMEGLEQSWISAPGQLRMVVGGSMVSTTLRVARSVVEGSRNHPFGASQARRNVGAMLRNAPPLQKFDRRRLSDKCLHEWIGDYLDRVPDTTKSAALRALRNAGFACEQGRFGVLFSQVNGDNS